MRGEVQVLFHVPPFPISTGRACSNDTMRKTSHAKHHVDVRHALSEALRGCAVTQGEGPTRKTSSACPTSVAVTDPMCKRMVWHLCRLYYARDCKYCVRHKSNMLRQAAARAFTRAPLQTRAFTSVKLPDLPYDYSALSPAISPEIMEVRPVSSHAL
jgi:hypothetical protein